MMRYSLCVMKFVNPWMLVLVALVPVAGAWWVFLRTRAEKRLSGLVAPALQGRLLPRNPRLFNVQAALMLAGLALVLFASARPQWGHSSQKMQARTRNVVVALDVSRSMLAADVRPNRLERAKADVADLIDSLEGDRCALVAFRRTGALLCPLTTDHGFLRSALESATPESAPRGETDLGSAIRTSLDALDPAADDHNAIILISDGGDLRGGARDAARLAAKRNVPVFTVGLGNPKAETAIPDVSGNGSQQYQGKAVTTKLEETALAEIAKISGGRYVPLATAGTAETTLGAIYRRFLRQVAAKEQAEEEELRATERFGVFLVPGLLLVLLAGMLSRGRFAGRTARKAAVAASLVLCGGIHAAGTNDVQRVADAAPYQAPAALDDREIWNRGVDAYTAGDWTNALATLQPLMLSRTHGARASEVVGAIRHENMKAVAAEDPVAAAKAASDAAAAMQIALRAAPDDPRANRNFTRATDRLAELRETAHVAEVLKATQGRGPDQLLGEAVRGVRMLMEEQKGVLTNEAAVAVAKSEAFARQADKLADTWIAVKQGVMQSVTNEQQAAVIVGDVEAARTATQQAAERLADMDPSAGESLATAETALTRFWKMTIMPPAAVDADLIAQSNAYLDVEAFNGRLWQPEALDFTRAFRARFPEWAKAYEQQAQADTNKPPFTKEQQDEISALATEIEKKQLVCLEKELPPEQLDVIKKLERIRELLPKDKNGGGQNNQQQNQQQNQDQNKKNDQNQDGQQQNQDNQQQDDNQQQEQKEQSQAQDPKDDKEVEELLQKAQERSEEHEADKKMRMRKAPLSPNERDW